MAPPDGEVDFRNSWQASNVPKEFPLAGGRIGWTPIAQKPELQPPLRSMLIRPRMSTFNPRAYLIQRTKDHRDSVALADHVVVVARAVFCFSAEIHLVAETHNPTQMPIRD